MKERIFMTDVNGTLTYARQPITGEMAEVLCNLVDEYKLVIITGAPWEDIKKQMPEKLVNHPNVDYYCNHGNVLMREGEVIYKTDAKIDLEMIEPLFKDVLKNCPIKWEGNTYPIHYEVYGDNTAINFTMMGRPEDGMPPQEDRDAYEAWDIGEVHQRLWVVDYLSKILPEYDITVGGQISIDIVKKGYDKTQVAKNYNKDDYKITFFGDRVKVHGNDNLIAHELADIGATIYNVHSPEQTLMFLKTVLSIAEMEKND